MRMAAAPFPREDIVSHNSPFCILWTSIDFVNALSLTYRLQWHNFECSESLEYHLGISLEIIRGNSLYSDVSNYIRRFTIELKPTFHSIQKMDLTITTDVVIGAFAGHCFCSNLSATIYIMISLDAYSKKKRKFHARRARVNLFFSRAENSTRFVINFFWWNDKMYLILVLANASILTNRIFPIVRAERSFVTIFSIETVETIAPKVPVTKNGKFHVRFVHIKPNEQRNTYI